MAWDMMRENDWTSEELYVGRFKKFSCEGCASELDAWLDVAVMMQPGHQVEHEQRVEKEHQHNVPVTLWKSRKGGALPVESLRGWSSKYWWFMAGF